MTGTPIKFLDTSDILHLHLIAIRDQGGDSAIRDAGLLESAMAMARQSFGGTYVHEGIPSMAGAYAFHICKNHPFVDGNKRAAFAAMVAFLHLNGWRLDVGVDEAESIIQRTASSAIDKPALIEWVRANSHEKARMELREFFGLLSSERLGAQMQAFGLGGSNEQIQLSIDEAKRAIPALNWIDQCAKSIDVSGQPTPANIERLKAQVMFQGMSVLLGAMHRIAEDMGYEW